MTTICFCLFFLLHRIVGMMRIDWIFLNQIFIDRCVYRVVMFSRFVGCLLRLLCACLCVFSDCFLLNFFTSSVHFTTHGEIKIICCLQSTHRMRSFVFFFFIHYYQIDRTIIIIAMGYLWAMGYETDGWFMFLFENDEFLWPKFFMFTPLLPTTDFKLYLALLFAPVKPVYIFS